MSSEIEVEDLHSFSLVFPTNVYGTCLVDDELLIASATEVLNIGVERAQRTKTTKRKRKNSKSSGSNRSTGDFLPSFSNRTWRLGRLQVFNLPQEGTILSVDAIDMQDQVYVALAAIQSRKGAFLQVAVWDGTSAFGSQDKGAVIRLNYYPFQVSHVVVNNQPFLLVGGSDGRVHIYNQLQGSEDFVEIEEHKDLPEFNQGFQTAPTSVSIYADEEQRVVAIGCVDGYTWVGRVATDASGQVLDGETMVEDSIFLDGPIARVMVYNTAQSELDTRHRLVELVETQLEEARGEEEDGIHLSVCGALGFATVFRNVITSLFTDAEMLDESDQHDSALCSTVMDVDLDGRLELVYGFHSGQVIVYQERERSNGSSSGSSSGNDGGQNEQGGEVQESRYEILWQRQFSEPVLALNVVDVTNDGLEELVVTTQSSVHVLQMSMEEAAVKLAMRLRVLSQRVASGKMAELEKMY